MSIVPEFYYNEKGLRIGVTYNCRIYNLKAAREGVLLGRVVFRDEDPFRKKKKRKVGSDERTAEEKYQAGVAADKRARSMVRKLCEANGCDALYTLTMDVGEIAVSRTRDLNRLVLPIDDMTDRAVFKYYVRLFLKRLRREYPGIAILNVVEKHKNNDRFHLHIGTNAFLSSGELRKVWGYGFVKIKLSDRVRKGEPSRTGSQRVGSYLAKYVGKGFGSGGQGRTQSEGYSGLVETSESIMDPPSPKLERGEGEHRYTRSRTMTLPFDEYLLPSGDLTSFMDLLESDGYKLVGELLPVEKEGIRWAWWGRSVRSHNLRC